jgi:hypothetical protein
MTRIKIMAKGIYDKKTHLILINLQLLTSPVCGKESDMHNTRRRQISGFPQEYFINN